MTKLRFGVAACTLLMLAGTAARAASPSTHAAARAAPGVALAVFHDHDEYWDEDRNEALAARLAQAATATPANQAPTQTAALKVFGDRDEYWDEDWQAAQAALLAKVAVTKVTPTGR